jgi:hypothetical protein
MFCPKCGTTNEENAQFCGKCGAPLAPGAVPPRQPIPQGQIPNYLVQSILTTVCCCLPLGIVAIVYAAQVNGKAAAGDYAGAKDCSDKAKMWAWIAFGCGLVVTILYMVYMFFVFSQMQSAMQSGRPF